MLLLPQALASMVSVVIGGRLVDKVGARAVMIPGLLVLAFTTWQLSLITLYSPFWWLQSLFVLRGIALGVSVQPLTVTSLSEISPRQLGQASSINTVTRSVASSLGIAILATLVQTQSKFHYGHLADLVTPSSPLGQLLPRLQAYFVSLGAAPLAAQSAALQVISGLVQRQAYVLAIEDAFTFTVVIIALAIIAVFFVPSRRQSAQTTRPTPRTTDTTAEVEAEEPAGPVYAMVE